MRPFVVVGPCHALPPPSLWGEGREVTVPVRCLAGAAGRVTQHQGDQVVDAHRSPGGDDGSPRRQDYCVAYSDPAGEHRRAGARVGDPRHLRGPQWMGHMGMDRYGAIIVTGGTGGLGQGVVRCLVDAGHRPVVTWLDEHERDRAREGFGDSVILERVDLSDSVAVRALVDRVDVGDGLWGVVHLVGGYQDGTPLGGRTGADLAGQMAVNVEYLATVLGVTLPRLVARGGGRVVAVGSRAGLSPFAGGGAYAASKAAAHALVRAAQAEVLDEGVTVNAVLPSIIDTAQNRAASPDADPAPWVRPEEIGAVIRFLMTREASGVTGALIPVYGRA